MALRVTNTLGRHTSEFTPLHEGFVGAYVCGPTVYGHSHLGHAKSYVSFDVIIRYLRCLGYKVRYVQNITDVGHLTDNADQGEDKITKQARIERVEPMELAESYTRSYFEDMDALNVLRPDISPRATGHIPEQIELVEKLLEKGHAYEINGSVYFDVTSWSRYGILSGRRLEELEEGYRVDVKEEKRHPADFALWKRAAPEDIMQWRSPWGSGYPGWHLECSVMSMKYIGETLDIHGGGLENVFPHHENEIAQSEAATGQPFVRYWLHNNMVTVNGQKMGKSLGNFITLKQAFAGEPPLGKAIDPAVIRIFILGSHYRSPLDFSLEALDAAQKGLQRIETAVAGLRERVASAKDGDASEAAAKTVEEYKAAFAERMDDDFNAPAALGATFDFVRQVNAAVNSGQEMTGGTLRLFLNTLEETGGAVLGIVTPRTGSRTQSVAGEEDALIDLLISTREELRRARQFELADGIRTRLADMGIQLEDTAEGTKWKRSG